MSDPRQIPEQDIDRMYEAAKKEWAESHPDATPEEYQRAMTEIARRLGV